MIKTESEKMKGYSLSHDKVYVALDILAEMLTEGCSHLTSQR